MVGMLEEEQEEEEIESGDGIRGGVNLGGGMSIRLE